MKANGNAISDETSTLPTLGWVRLNFLDLAQGNADILQTIGLEPIRTLPRPHCRYAKFAQNKAL